MHAVADIDINVLDVAGDLCVQLDVLVRHKLARDGQRGSNRFAFDGSNRGIDLARTSVTRGSCCGATSTHMGDDEAANDQAEQDAEREKYFAASARCRFYFV